MAMDALRDETTCRRHIWAPVPLRIPAVPTHQWLGFPELVSTRRQANIASNPLALVLLGSLSHT